MTVEWKPKAGVWTLGEGKIGRVVCFATPADVLEATGLSE
jgi:hypothetical protein